MPSAPVFTEELARFGPSAPPRQITLSEADDYCQRLATSHYENFPVLAWFLPRTLRPHFCRVYAYCRWADDLADEVGTAEDSLALLKWWRGQLRLCYEGQPTHPVLIALQPTVREFEIPPTPFEDLVSAFEQDQRVKEYQTFDQLRDYCRRSADPVGRLVLYLFRKHQPENLGWSDSICTGLQLANFWQDVSRDKDIGRVYLPAEDRQRFGYDDAALASRTTNDAFLNLMRFEVDRARQLLKPWRSPSQSELRDFPYRLRVALDLFARGGLRILDRIERVGYRVWDVRPKVTKSDVALLTLTSLWRMW